MSLNCRNQTWPLIPAQFALPRSHNSYVTFLVGQSRGWQPSTPVCGYPRCSMGCLGNRGARNAARRFTLHLQREVSRDSTVTRSRTGPRFNGSSNGLSGIADALRNVTILQCCSLYFLAHESQAICNQLRDARLRLGTPDAHRSVRLGDSYGEVLRGVPSTLHRVASTRRAREGLGVSQYRILDDSAGEVRRNRY
jgi:hypothetical protein